MSAGDAPRRFLAGFGVVALPALVLVALHGFLPAAVHDRLLLRHGDLELHALWTAAYVHAGDAHLRANLQAYAVAAGYTYLLCYAAGERRWFYATFAAALVVLPAVVNALSVGFYRWQYPELEPVSRGFSGVAAGFGGFLLVALGVYLRNRHGRQVAVAVAGSVFLVLLFEIDVIHAGGVRPVVAGLVALGLGLFVGGYVHDHGLPRETDRRRLLFDAGATTLIVGVLSYLVVGLFPAEIVAGDEVRNVVAHAIGFLAGAAMAGGAYLVERDR